MKVPLEITFRDVQPDESTEVLIRKRAEKLERFCDYLSSCRIAVERESQRRREGNHYHVRIDLTVPPSHELVVSRDPSSEDRRDELPVVIRRAFDAAQKQLKELVAKQRRDVKSHPEQDLAGVVVRLFRNEGYGFLPDLEGREIYFHCRAMSEPDWSRVQIGTG